MHQEVAVLFETFLLYIGKKKNQRTFQISITFSYRISSALLPFQSLHNCPQGKTPLHLCRAPSAAFESNNDVNISEKSGSVYGRIFKLN